MRNKPRLIFLLNSAQRRLQQWMQRQAEATVAAAATTAATTARTATPVTGLQPLPSPAQSGVLFVLDKTDGATMGELALALDLAPSAVSGLVQRMEALGWVQRQACTDDGRTQRVWLQAAGRRQLPALKQATARINSRLAQGFTDAELQTVARWLTHVQQLDPDEPPG